MDSATCIAAATPEELGAAKELIEEYARSLGCSPCLANIDRELRGFPQPFTPPRGLLLIALQDGETAGVVGVKELPDDAAEMARLYVPPRFRGQGLGRLLASAALAGARRLGYQTLRLYTLPAMTTALALYQQMGFREIPPYADQPVPGAFYLEKSLR